jgi:hypothetical protein
MLGKDISIQRRRRMKGTKILLIFVLAIFIAMPAYGKDKMIEDPLPAPNIVYPNAYPDYRDYGAWIPHREDSDAWTGAWFHVTIGVVLDGSYLQDYRDIIEVRARHVEQGQELILIPEPPSYWWTGEYQYWNLYLRLNGWMLQGNWEFYLIYYNPSDGKTHLQTAYHEMGPVTFPLKPAYIEVNTSPGSFIVSWNGIGDPRNPSNNIDYRLRILKKVGSVWTGPKQYRGDWTGGPDVAGEYDAVLNKVTFTIPDVWGGCIARLENRSSTLKPSGRWQFNRAMNHVILAE